MENNGILNSILGSLNSFDKGYGAGYSRRYGGGQANNVSVNNTTIPQEDKVSADGTRLTNTSTTLTSSDVDLPPSLYDPNSEGPDWGSFSSELLNSDLVTGLASNASSSISTAINGNSNTPLISSSVGPQLGGAVGSYFGSKYGEELGGEVGGVVGGVAGNVVGNVATQQVIKYGSQAVNAVSNTSTAVDVAGAAVDAASTVSASTSASTTAAQGAGAATAATSAFSAANVLGAASIAAEYLIPENEATFNTTNDYRNFDFSASGTEQDAKDEATQKLIFSGIGAGLSIINPAVGAGWNLVTTLGRKYVNDNRSQNLRGLSDEYQSLRVGAEAKNTKNKTTYGIQNSSINNIYGNNAFLSGGLLEQGAEGDPYVIGGKRHEQGGTTVAPGKTAEKGEVRYGDFIFTDRF